MFRTKLPTMHRHRLHQMYKIHCDGHEKLCWRMSQQPCSAMVNDLRLDGKSLLSNECHQFHPNGFHWHRLWSRAVFHHCSSGRDDVQAQTSQTQQKVHQRPAHWRWIWSPWVHTPVGRSETTCRVFPAHAEWHQKTNSEVTRLGR